MTNFLAIDTATDACSVALSIDGDCRQCFELAPRRHNQLLFDMLSELVPRGDLRAAGVEALAYSCGPGSFTGLRIGASAVQGLAYSLDLPAVPVPTLAALAQAGVRTGCVTPERPILALLDARVDEVYWQLFAAPQDGAEILEGPGVCAPEALPASLAEQLPQILGDGLVYRERLPEAFSDLVVAGGDTVLPSALDLIPLAEAAFATGRVQRADRVSPVYVRDEVSWKKLSEQGKPA